MHDVEHNGQRRPALTGVEPGPTELREAPKGEYDLPLKELLRASWRRLWVIALVVFVFVGSAIYLSYQQTPTYEASVRVIIGQQPTGTGEQPRELFTDLQGLQGFAKAATGLANSRPVADAVIRRQGFSDLEITPADLRENMRVEQIDGSQVVEIAYRDTNPERAAEVVNTLGEVFSEQVPKWSPGGNAVTAMVWEEAEVPGGPVSPNTNQYVIVALALGGLLGIGLALLLERLDDRWRSPEEVEQISSAPTVGVIPRYKLPRKFGSKEASSW